MGEDNLTLKKLANRIGQKHFERRLDIQKHHATEVYNGIGLSRFHPENSDSIIDILKIVLKVTGFHNKAVKNSLDIRVEKQVLVSETLPSSLHGFTILQLSDLHIEGFTDGGEMVCNLLQTLSYDLCVITGDFRLRTYGDYSRAIILTERIVRSVNCPYGIAGILGNHDFIEMVPELEHIGITMLINENIRIGNGNGTILVAGLDDIHLYGTDDIEKALEGRKNNEFTLLMAHTPELYREASALGVNYYLCGHTHGGQICLPNGNPLFTNTKCPKEYVSGSWEFGEMRGYTSRGTGISGLPARFFCPPEVTLHTLLSTSSLNDM